MSELTRGEANNNPGGVTKSDAFKWFGELEGEDPRLARFACPEDGIRAVTRLLRGYQARSGLRTVRQLVNRFAPGHEKPLAIYVAQVAAHVGVEPDAEVDLELEETMTAIVAGIIQAENGRIIYDEGTLERGVRAGRQ